MGRARTIRRSERTDGFLFLGNEMALDFLNTCPVQNGEPLELLADFSSLLRWFQAARLLSARDVANLRRKWGRSAGARCIVKAVCDLREMLRKEVVAWERGAAVRQAAMDELNRLMAAYPMRTRLKARRGKASAMELWFEPRQPEDLLAPLAHGAATLLAGVDRKRVRKCAGCIGHFYDVSKKGTRRWCSMQLCGNRFKVAAYAARQRIRTAE